ncbi:MAG: glycosyltransferase family 4 protein [Halobacteriovoraceae bacterium]|nr:glycosyltransferase family 4 protein [Halobacteriovoraceae bacterium]
MKVLILSPFFPPLINGLSHYTQCFANNLSEKGEDVTVACNEGLGNDQDIPIIPLKDWSWFSFCDLLQIIRERRFDTVLIQYVPHMYNRKGGINFSLPLFVILLRLLGQTKIEIMFHELHYPLEPKPLSVVLWLIHHLMLFPLLWFSHRCFFSTQRYLKKAKNLSIKKTLFFLPVGSNIPRWNGKYDALGRNGELSLGFFGGPHASKIFTPVFKGLELSSQKFHLHFMGIDEKKFTEAYGDNFKSFNYTFHGTMSDSDLSQIISRIDLLCAYFTDGLSARRGSVLASLNNGTPVLTTKSPYTEELFFSFPGVILLDRGDSFPKSLAQYFKEYSGEKKKINDDILEAFDRTFSWNSIIKKYLNFRT